MTYRIISLAACLLCLHAAGANAEPGPWSGKKAAVALTYDDSLNIHLDEVIPALNKHKLKGTFYLSLSPKAFSSRMGEWKKAARNGHELGNHTLFHPCDGGIPGREWVKPDYDLSKYSVDRMHDEISLTNDILHYVDGKKERTYAYTCGDTSAGSASYVEAIKPLFPAARGVSDTFSSIKDFKQYDINSYMVNGDSGEKLISLVKQAIEEEKLVVFLFHGVGGEHVLNVSSEAHSKLLKFLRANRKEVWVATMLDLANYATQKP